MIINYLFKFCFQGLSFLAASLLLHMPEEQAFCVLVRVMFHYGLRDLFKVKFTVHPFPDIKKINILKSHSIIWVKWTSSDVSY